MTQHLFVRESTNKTNGNKNQSLEVPEPYELPICDQFIDSTCMMSVTEVSAHNEVHKSNGKTNEQKECYIFVVVFFYAS